MAILGNVNYWPFSGYSFWKLSRVAIRMNKTLWVINVFYLHIAGKLNGVIPLSNWHLRESNLHQPIGRIWSIFGILFGSHKEYWAKNPSGHNFFVMIDMWHQTDTKLELPFVQGTYSLESTFTTRLKTSCESYILGGNSERYGIESWWQIYFNGQIVSLLWLWMTPKK